MSRYAAVTWTDAKGNFWLFGGWSDNLAGTYTYLNDLWEYNVTLGQGTWMSGSLSGWGTGSTSANPVYGTLAVPGPGNTPGATVSGTGLTDLNGNLWLFGGQGFPNVNNAGNELWEFNTPLGQWSWMGGGSQPGGSPEGYGTMGQADPASYPTPRSGSVGWTDSSGKFWLFAGLIYPNSGDCVDQEYLNDIWEYNPSTHLWAWMGGSNKSTVTVGASGCYEAGV